MLLARKPVLPPMFPPTSHRRHPSAPPAVIVQPTKVPGILSISKPLRADSPRQHRQQNPHNRNAQRTSKPKHANAESANPAHEKPPLAEKPVAPIIPVRQALDPLRSTSLDNVARNASTPTPDKQPRGRQKKAPKDKTPARGSSAHGHSRRNNARQPSPPISSSQIEGPVFSPPRNPTANSFDPFIVSSDSDSDANSRPAFPSNSRATKLSPTLAPPPPGKSARRRNQTVQPPATPSPASRPVPVPGNKHSTHRNNLSRSAPVPHALSRMDKRRASTGHATDTDFPVCDDTTDVEDTSPPSTPFREHPADHTWQHLSLNGPRTAPLSPFNVFSFASAADSTPTRPRHHHHRTPSEGVFNMSLDEDMSSTSDASEELKKLFGFPPKRFGSVGPSASHAGKDKAGFFASSVFQNSPSPDELPPPAF